jgi:predicted nucleic acid-binding protein
LPGDGLLPAIVLAELMLGPNRAITSRQRQEANAFLADVREVLTVVPFGEDEAARHAQLWVQLKEHGNEIGDHDLQIAATALVGAHELMTYNVKEFANVPGLRLVPAPGL